MLYYTVIKNVMQGKDQDYWESGGKDTFDIKGAKTRAYIHLACLTLMREKTSAFGRSATSAYIRPCLRCSTNKMILIT